MVTYKVGDKIDNKYEVLKVLGGPGKSGQGIVYVCKDEDKIIALKTLQDGFLKSEKMVNSFKREALAWVQLENHPFIVRAYFIKNIDNHPFIAIDYIGPDKKERNTLKQHMKSGPISLRKMLKWSIQFCYAMEYAKSKGISPHRDIKPDNIMISASGRVKLTDFGLVKFLDEKDRIKDWKKMAEAGEQSVSFLRVSQDLGPSGTVPWMSPEQFEGNTDERSDIYSFGIVLYQMINEGKLPFRLNTIEAYYNAHCDDIPKEIDSPLFPIVKKCLEKDPKERYQGFGELRVDFENLHESEIGKTIPGKRLPRLPKEKRMRAEDHNNKGVSFATLGFIDDAIEEFRRALELKPGFTNARINLGMTLNKIEEYEEAIQNLKEALQKKPNSLQIQRQLGKVFEANGQIKEAIERYVYIVRVAPYYIAAHYHLARLNTIVGNIDDAIMYFENYLNFTPSNDSKVKDAKKQLKKLKKQKKKSK